MVTLPIFILLVELVGFEPTTHRSNRLALPTELQPRAYSIGLAKIMPKLIPWYNVIDIK
jgi:uncharacterized membrane protein (DUF106 family)